MYYRPVIFILMFPSAWLFSCIFILFRRRPMFCSYFQNANHYFGRKNLSNTSIAIEGWTVSHPNKEGCLSWSRKKEMLHMFYFLYRVKKTRVDENDCLTSEECLVHFFFFAYFCHPSSFVIRMFLLLCLTQDLMVSFREDGIWETSSSLFSLLLMPNPSFSRETMLICQSFSLREEEVHWRDRKDKLTGTKSKVNLRGDNYLSRLEP